MTITNELKMFQTEEKKDVFNCSIFRVNEQKIYSHDKQHSLNVYTLQCSNWVNIIPVLPDGKIVLIEQQRFGVGSHVLEVPGGSVFRDEKDLTMSAVRELEEETGLTSKKILALSGFYPNPAIQGNRVTYFIAFDCTPLEKPVDHDDPFEEIKLHIVDKSEAISMARSGRISHALSALALLVAEPYLTTRGN